MIGITTCLVLCTALIPVDQDTVPPVDVVISAQDVRDGAGLISLAIGETAGLTLGTNPSTGLRWHLEMSEPADSIVLVAYDGYSGDPNPDRMAGVGGQRHWVFRALRPGRTTVTLTRSRQGPPEAGSPGALSFVMEVVDLPGDGAKSSGAVLLEPDARGGVWVGCGDGFLSYYDAAPMGRICGAAGYKLAADTRGGVWAYCGGHLNFYDRAPMGRVCR